jgi:endonuclease/exonuclease/phosphatase (EEP) superfamily protein YafD
VSLNGLLTAAGALACIATLAAMGGRFHWLLDLCSHFPVQCAIFLFLAGVVLGFRRKRAVCAIFLVFALWNAAKLFPQVLSANGPEPSPAVQLKTLLINVQTDNKKFAKVKDLVRARNPDLVVFEEVNDEWMSQLEPLRAAFPHVVAEPREDNFGIVLFSRLPLRDAKVTYFGDAGVPSIVARVATSAGEVVVFATHPLPPVGAEHFNLRNDQLQRIAEYLRTVSGPAILLGDLNTSPWSFHFKRFVQVSALVDTSRGQGWQPTWPVIMPLLFVPIDHALCTKDIVVLSRETGANIGSDHYPLVVTFGIAR